MRSITAFILATSFAVILCGSIQAQSKKNDKQYEITDKLVVPHTMVQNQGSSGTCWCFAGTGFVEAEILRKYGVELNLSEMYFVRWAFMHKFMRHVRMHGTTPISQGGEVCDVLYALNENGMVPDESYDGLVLGLPIHKHAEMNSILAEYGKVVTKKSNGDISTVWPDMVQSILDVYLGKVPESFEHNGIKYDAKSFAEKYRLNTNDYVQLAAFTHRELHKPFIMEIPDNWTNTPSYNLTLDELMEAIDHALEAGYTVGWAQDVSDKGFSRKKGIAVYLEDDIAKIRESDPKRFKELSDDELSEAIYKFDFMMPEKEVTEEMHQTAYDNWQTGDDHSMLIVGIAYDQDGNKYYKVKNSWGEAGPYKGYWYCSVPFVRLHTVFVTVNKEALNFNVGY